MQALVTWCAEHRVALVPFGGGTSVVGGLTVLRDGYAGVVSLDLRRLDGLVSVDAESRTAVLQAGVLGPAAEELLGEHGLMLGHFPQSYRYASIGGFAATRSSGQASSGYGRFDALVVGLTVATPIGTLELGSAPASAAGPDLRQLVLGSEGAFGVITSVTVRVRPVPSVKVYDGWRFDSFAAGTAALRTLAQSGSAPTVLRLSDENETAINLAQPDQVGGASAGGCLMIAGFEGEPADVSLARAAAAAGWRRPAASGTRRRVRRGGRPVPRPVPARRDARRRRPGGDPGDRDVLVRPARAVPRGDRRRHRALAADAPLVLCHVSHVYPTGASLYFTVAAKQRGDGLDQWARAKAAASDAIVAAGATITHHHAVGRTTSPGWPRRSGRSVWRCCARSRSGSTRTAS